jgi:hypothetical protein
MGKRDHGVMLFGRSFPNNRYKLLMRMLTKRGRDIHRKGVSMLIKKGLGRWNAHPL